MLEYSVIHWEYDFLGELKETGKTTYRIYDSCFPNSIIIDNGGYAKTIRIRNSKKFTYKINKDKTISAIGGKNGFMEFLKRELENNSGGFYPIICKKVLGA